jgi:hypothetical protein
MIMTSDQFYEQFDQLQNDQSRINFMKGCFEQGYAYYLESQPGAIMSRFYSIGTFGDATPEAISQVFVLCFGYEMVSRESSYCSKTPMSIIDDMEWDAAFHANYPTEGFTKRQCQRAANILAALKQMGVKAGADNQSALKQHYSLDPAYHSALFDGSLQWAT